MRVDLDQVKALLEQAAEEPASGDAFVDGLYDSVVPITGHTNPYYAAFYLIAMELEPRLTVELGSWRAIAAAHFAVGNPDGFVYTVDIHKDDKEAQRICRQVDAQIPNLKYLNGWTWDDHVLDEIRGDFIDILYIDAWHERQYVEREWNLYQPLLSDEALIIMDDIFNAAGATVGMEEFWNEFEYEKFLDTSLHSGIPMGYMRYIR